MVTHRIAAQTSQRGQRFLPHAEQQEPGGGGGSSSGLPAAKTVWELSVPKGLAEIRAAEGDGLRREGCSGSAPARCDVDASSSPAKLIIGALIVALPLYP